MNETKCLSECASKVLSEEKTYFWEAKKKDKIELTVALPIKSSKKIIWLALESLRRQINITFFWELIIWDDGESSLDALKIFTGKFPNCLRVVYRYIHTQQNKPFLLIDKWIGMAGDASLTSKIFVLHAADCYSPPKRLFVHYEHFKHEHCFFSTQTKGLFFNLITKKHIFYAPFQSKKEIKNKKSSSHLNMALLLEDMKSIESSDKKRGIDGYILKNIIKKRNIKQEDMSNHIFHYESVDPEGWKNGVDTDGANHLSIYRRRFYNSIDLHPGEYFIVPNRRKEIGYDKIEKNLPKTVYHFLMNYK
jgi:hypothetical protein